MVQVNLVDTEDKEVRLCSSSFDNNKHYLASPFALSVFDTPPENALKALGTLAREATKLEEVVDFLDTVLKHARAEYELIVSGAMPKIMAQAGVSKFTTEDGSTCENKTQLFASLPKEDQLARERALKWINEQGGGGLIKDKLVVESPTQDLINEVKGKFPMERIQDIHPSTLKAFMSDLLGYKKGSVARFTEEEVPPELHVFVKNTVSVK